MATNLYVGGLPYSTTDEAVRELFAQIGEVRSVRVMIDRETQQSRGFAFVEMADEAGAQQAITQLNGTPFGGRTLMVNEARPREERSGGGGGGGYNSGGGGGGGGYGNDRGGSRRSY